MWTEKHVLVQKEKLYYFDLKTIQPICIQREGRLNRSTIASTLEIVDSVNAFILTSRRVTIEVISEQLEISASTAHKIVYDDLAFFKISSCLDNARLHTVARTMKTMSQFG